MLLSCGVVDVSMIGVTWIDRKTNVWVIDNIKPEWTLESRIVKKSLCYFGHVTRAGGMEYEVLVGRIRVIKAEGDHGKDGWIAQRKTSMELSSTKVE